MSDRCEQKKIFQLQVCQLWQRTNQRPTPQVNLVLSSWGPSDVSGSGVSGWRCSSYSSCPPPVHTLYALLSRQGDLLALLSYSGQGNVIISVLIIICMVNFSLIFTGRENKKNKNKKRRHLVHGSESSQNLVNGQVLDTLLLLLVWTMYVFHGGHLSIWVVLQLG